MGRSIARFAAIRQSDRVYGRDSGAALSEARQDDTIFRECASRSRCCSPADMTIGRLLIHNVSSFRLHLVCHYDTTSLTAQTLFRMTNSESGKGQRMATRGRRAKGEYPEKKRVFASRVREDTWAKLQQATEIAAAQPSLFWPAISCLEGFRTPALSRRKAMVDERPHPKTFTIADMRVAASIGGRSPQFRPSGKPHYTSCQAPFPGRGLSRTRNFYSPVCNNVPARREAASSRAKTKAAPAKRSASIASPISIRSVRRTWSFSTPRRPSKT